MQIVHEAPSQRRTHRVNAPITIVIDGLPYRTVDWSLIDFKIADYQGPIQPGDVIDMVVQIPYQGFNVSFRVEARAVNKNMQQQTLAGEFMAMDERGKEILETFVAGLVRGEMESIRGVIRRMDVPVTPASLKPDVPMTKEEIDEQERRRTLGSIFYLVAGAAFFVALLIVVYTNFFQIKVRTAVMAAPTDIIIAPATGHVKKFNFNERETIAETQDMIVFEDPELEQNIERAAMRLEDALAAKKGSASTSVSPELASARASANALQQTLNIKASALSRLKALQGQGLAIQRDVDRAEAEYFDAKAELSKAMERVTGSSVQTTSSASVLSIADGEYNLLKEQRNRLVVKAPAKGRIIKMLQREATSVRYGDPVAIFQHDDPKYIEAYLTREEALSVAVGDVATVFFPSFGKDMKFKVSDVDYASQLVSHRDGMYVMQQAGLTRDVLVRLVLDDKDYADLVEQIVPGTAAEVVFSKFKFGSAAPVAAPVDASAVPTAATSVTTKDTQAPKAIPVPLSGDSGKDASK